MQALSITSLASLKRALAIPGLLVFMDRNDILAHRLVRDPTAMATAMRPRTVHAVRSTSVVMLRGEEVIHVDLPKASALRADGSNAVSIAHRRQDDGQDSLITYRLEIPGSPGAAMPSRLPQNHPPLLAEELRAEDAETARLAAAAEARRAAHAAELRRVTSRAMPPADPRYPILRQAMKDAVSGALDAGLSTTRDIEEYVRTRCAVQDFAVTARLADVVCDKEHGARSIAERDARIDLAAHHRGTWRLLIVAWNNGVGRSETLLVSTGDAREAAHYPGLTGDETLLRRLQASEIYALREEVERERRQDRDRRAFERRRFEADQTFRALRINAETYSTATVVGVDPATCEIKLRLRRRGSPKVFSVTLTASVLDALAPADTRPTAGALI